MKDSPTSNGIDNSEFDPSDLKLDDVAFYGRTLSEYMLFFWHK